MRASLYLFIFILTLSCKNNASGNEGTSLSGKANNDDIASIDKEIASLEKRLDQPQKAPHGASRSVAQKTKYKW